MNKSFAILLLLLSACAHKTPAPNDVLVSEPSQAPGHAFQSTDPNQVTIAVVGLNDFHGNLMPKERKLGDRVIQSGGASALASMIQILRKEMNDRVLIVDAGDEWQGTLESNQVKGATVIEFYNRLGVNVAAIGNHEFDFTVPTMSDNFGKAKFPYVGANIFEKKNHRHPKWKNYFPSRLFTVGGIEVGVIGVSTMQTPSTTRYEYVKHLNFENASQPVTEESQKLRAKGASIVLVTSHAGTICEENGGLKTWKLRDESMPDSKCDAEQEIYQLAKDLKPGTLDGIVSGHTHEVIHHWLNHIPVVQDEAFDQHFNIIYYTFNRTTKKVIPELTRIEGLVPICTQTFAGLQHCDVRRLAKGASPALEPAIFHGEVVKPDPNIEAWLQPIVQKTAALRNEVVGTTELPLAHSRREESVFGNFVADVLREAGHADLAVTNSGGIRTSIDAGPITYDQIFQALPFDNFLNVLKLKGKDVKLLIRIGTANTHSLINVSGLKMKLLPLEQDPPKTDLNGDGKLEAWEGNRVVDLRLSNGKPIDDEHVYTVATYDYLVNGEADLSWFMKKIPRQNIDSHFAGYCRDIVLDYLKKVKVVNTKSHPFIDPQNPRIEFTH